MKIQMVDLPEGLQFKMRLESLCTEVKNGATRGYVELQLRTVFAGTKWSNLLKVLNNVSDEQFARFVYNVYLVVMGLRAPKNGRNW